MKPLIRTHSIVFTITTTAIFFLWGLLENLISNNPGLKAFFGGLIAVGTYRLTLSLIILIVNNCNWIKKILFSNYYLDGTWIGIYINYQKEPMYFIEEYEQGYDKLVIRGRAYYNDGCYKGSWISDSFNIDGENGVLSYNYRRDSIDVTFINPGQAIFYFIRHKKPPEKLTGFYCDLYDNKKARALLIKVKNDTEKNLIQNAKRIFEENEDFFKKDFSNYTNNSSFYTKVLRDEI